MTLTQWRKEQGLSLEAVADKLDKSKGHIHAVEASGHATPGLALAIEKLTNGRVNAASLNDHVAEARRTAA